MKSLLNQFAQYEICFGNRFNVKPNGLNIKSTGFKLVGEGSIVYLTDLPNADLKTGVISIIKIGSNGQRIVVAKEAGVVDYMKGEVILNTLNIVETERPNNIIEIQAFPESNDVVGLKDLYLSFNVPSSTINMVKDVIASGEDISGVSFTRDYYTSSYSNGDLERK